MNKKITNKKPYETKYVYCKRCKWAYEKDDTPCDDCVLFPNEFEKLKK